MSEFAPNLKFSGKIPFDPDPKFGGYSSADILSGKAGLIDYNPFDSGASKSDFFGSSATKAGVNFLDNYLKNLDKERRTDPKTGQETAKSPVSMAASGSQLASGLTEQRDPFYMMKTGGKFIPGSKGIGERLAGAAVGFAKGAITGQPHMAGLGAVTGFMG